MDRIAPFRQWRLRAILTLICITIFAQIGLTFAQAQKIAKTQYTSIYYTDPAELRDLEGRLKFAPGQNFSQDRCFRQDPDDPAISPPLIAKVDGLLLQVCRILNRWPPIKEPLHLFLLRDGRQVGQRCLDLTAYFHSSSQRGPKSMEAFYEPLSRTIFLSLADLDEMILAHEMVHFVLCESFKGAPPTALQEDWAHYVEQSPDLTRMRQPLAR